MQSALISTESFAKKISGETEGLVKLVRGRILSWSDCTTKIVAWAKSVWDRYVTLDDLRHPSGIS